MPPTVTSHHRSATAHRWGRVVANPAMCDHQDTARRALTPAEASSTSDPALPWGQVGEHHWCTATCRIRRRHGGDDVPGPAVIGQGRGSSQWRHVEAPEDEGMATDLVGIGLKTTTEIQIQRGSLDPPAAAPKRVPRSPGSAGWHQIKKSPGNERLGVRPSRR